MQLHVDKISNMTKYAGDMKTNVAYGKNILSLFLKMLLIKLKQLYFSDGCATQ